MRLGVIINYCIGRGWFGLVLELLSSPYYGLLSRMDILLVIDWPDGDIRVVYSVCTAEITRNAETVYSSGCSFTRRVWKQVHSLCLFIRHVCSWPYIMLWGI